MPFWAHSPRGRPGAPRHSLREHLEDTGSRAESRAAKFGAGIWGQVAGRLHDIGKYSREFQARLDGDLARVDHATAGAKLAVQTYGHPGRLIAFGVAGHHAGLADGIADKGLRTALEDRLSKDVPDHAAWRTEITLPAALAVPPLQRSSNAKVAEARAGFQLAFFARMLFSCLVDADRLDTEAYGNRIEGRETLRGSWPSLAEIQAQLDTHLVENFKGKTGEVNRLRAEILAAARAHAADEPGLFSLTVPTGGGKTLSSLAFALDHAVTHGLARVIYVIPYTSIIEQTAETFRTALGPLSACVLEHHSAFDDEAARATASRDGEPGVQALDKLRLATEDWGAPIVVTTAVQFFESLFAAAPGKCRKLHNIARSVVILDEAQMLPLPLLRPCVAAIDELARNYGASVVLCTATQPALEDRPEDPGRSFVGGFRDVREIAPDRERLYEALKRVTMRDLGEVGDANLAERLRDPAHDQVLCIVNTRAHARILYEALGDSEGAFHLSALMCPAHRSQRLAAIRAALKEGRPCRVVATSLVEAGVDVDFPIVYRAEAGLDSIAQAAGRCNREGRRAWQDSIVSVFTPEAGRTPKELGQLAGAMRSALRRHQDDPLSLAAIEAYFREVYWMRSVGRQDGLDAKCILPMLKERCGDLMFPFETVAREFRMIEDEMRPILIPFDDTARGLLRALEAVERPGGIARRLQRYVVQVSQRDFVKLFAAEAIASVQPGRFGDQFWSLVNDRLYRPDTGLTFADPEVLSTDRLIFCP